MLHNAGYRCDIVSPDRLTEEGFDGYKLISTSRSRTISTEDLPKPLKSG